MLCIMNRVRRAALIAYGFTTALLRPALDPGSWIAIVGIVVGALVAIAIAIEAERRRLRNAQIRSAILIVLQSGSPVELFDLLTKVQGSVDCGMKDVHAAVVDLHLQNQVTYHLRPSGASRRWFRRDRSEISHISVTSATNVAAAQGEVARRKVRVEDLVAADRELKHFASSPSEWTLGNAKALRSTLTRVARGDERLEQYSHKYQEELDQLEGQQQRSEEPAQFEDDTTK